MPLAAASMPNSSITGLSALSITASPPQWINDLRDESVAQDQSFNRAMFARCVSP